MGQMTDIQFHQIMMAIYTLGMFTVDRLWAFVLMAIMTVVHMAVVVMLMLQ